jgi:hypothetical protein
MKSRKSKTTPIAPGIVMHFDGRDLFLIVDGVQVAKRGHPNTSQARTWIALDPRFKAHGDDWSYHSDNGTAQ